MAKPEYLAPTQTQWSNTKDVLKRIYKGTPVARMAAANIIPKTIVVEHSTVEKMTSMMVEGMRRKLLEELDLSSLNSWTPTNQEKAMDLLAKIP